MRPIEFYGWDKLVLDNSEVFSKNNNISVFIRFDGMISFSIVETYPGEQLSLEELKAIYDTAKEIKDEKSKAKNK